MTDQYRVHARRRARPASQSSIRFHAAAVMTACIAMCAPAATAQTANEGSSNESQHQAGSGDGGHHGASGARADGHAPIGVMGDHIHKKGEWMASYRFMRMSMEDNRIGTTDVPNAAILTSLPPTPPDGYGVVPTRMTMDMHMLGVMYAPSDWLTLMGMFPFLVLDMDHISATGVEFTTRSTGIGDIGVAALLRLFETKRHEMHVNLGFTFPTGSIDRRDVVPTSAPNSTLLPYPMQLGGGTWNILPGITYNGRTELFSWGAQAMGNIRIGRNEQDYSLGDSYSVTGWGAWRVVRWLSLSGRLDWRQWFDIEGRDSRLMAPPLSPWQTAAAFIPTADPDLRGGKRLDIGPGVNFVVPGTMFEDVRLAFEMLFPVYQDLDGPQLKTDWTLVVGTQYAW